MGVIFATYGVLCVGWTQAASMLELVLRLRYLENTENPMEQERKSAFSKKMITIGLVIAIVVTIGFALVFIGLLAQMAITTDFKSMEELISD